MAFYKCFVIWSRGPGLESSSTSVFLCGPRPQSGSGLKTMFAKYFQDQKCKLPMGACYIPQPASSDRATLAGRAQGLTAAQCHCGDWYRTDPTLKTSPCLPLPRLPGQSQGCAVW